MHVQSEKIPGKIHFVWLGSKIPEKYVDNINHCADHNRGMQINLWTDDISSNAKNATTRIVKTENPRFHEETNMAAKADVLRYEIISSEGGIYSDVDSIYLRSFDSDIMKNPFVSHTFDPWNNLTNAVFGFPAGHEFMGFVVESLRHSRLESDITRRTGPDFFTSCYRRYRGDESSAWREFCSRDPWCVHQDKLVYPKRSAEKDRKVWYSFHTNDASWSTRKPIPRSRPKVSYCTSIRNRLGFLKETLPQNLMDARADSEFVVLDYGSSDGLSEWIRPYVSNGLVQYFQAHDQKFWRNSHAKNVAAWCATGGVVCNVDADNYITRGFHEHVVGNAEKGRALSSPPGLRGVTGRIACHKTDFLACGGYNERFSFGWGCEDIDLVTRLRFMGVDVKYIPMAYLEHIDHEDSIRSSESEDRSISSSRSKSHRIMEECLKRCEYVSNSSQPKCGQSRLTRNYVEEIRSGWNPRTELLKLP